MVFKTHPLRDIASCIAWDKLVELEKMKNIVMIKIVEVMSNYEKKLLSSVAYHMNIEGLLELNAEAPIFVQVRHVAQTSIVVAPVTLRRETFIVR